MLPLVAAALVIASPVSVHRFTSSEAHFVANSWLVETAHGVVVVDTQFTVSEGKAAHAKLEGLKKPVLAVLLTHAHPDHVNGTKELLAGAQVPVVALEKVKAVLEKIDAPKRAFWTPIVKDDYPAATVFPDRILKSGESITFDGVTFTGFDLGLGESDEESVWVAGDKAFVGDLLTSGVHPWLAEGHSGAWLQSLTALEKLAAAQGVKSFFPGHGAEGGVATIAWQRRYLETYRAAVKELAAGKPALDAAAKKRLEEKLEAFLPKAPLQMLVAMSADAVAAELQQ
jgi:glyoxylase-like metal-dependent hydrolase (beta-lactamase superfamily II)